MGAANILGALAGGYATAAERDYRQKFEAEMGQRKALVQMYWGLANDSTLNPKVREAALGAGLGVVNTPMGKKVKAPTIEDLAKAAMPQATGPPTGGPAGLGLPNISATPGATPPFQPSPGPRAGVAPSVPIGPPGAPPDIQLTLPSIELTPTSPPTLPPPPPGYQPSLWLSPEEQARQTGRAHGVAMSAALRTAQEMAPQIIGDEWNTMDAETRTAVVYGMATGMSLPSFAGRGTLVPDNRFASPDDPSKPLPLLRNNRTGEYVTPGGAAVDVSQLVPYERPATTRSGWIMDEESSTGYSQVSIDPRTGKPVGEPTRDLVPPAYLMPQITSGEVTVVTDEGVYRVPSTTVRRPSLPGPPPGGAGRAPSRTPAREDGEPGRRIGTRTPAALRVVGETAQSALDKISSLRTQIAELDKAGMLGPLMGRWNEFVLGTWRGEGLITTPERARLFSDFHSNLSLMRSALAMTHAGRRLGPQIMAYFEGVIPTGAADRSILNGALDATERWLEGYAAMSPTTETGRGKREDTKPKRTIRFQDLPE